MQNRIVDLRSDTVTKPSKEMWEALRSLDNKDLGDDVFRYYLSRGFVDRLQTALPQAQLIEIPTNRQFFDEGFQELDALLISAESGSVFTLLYPEFEVVVPTDLRVTLPLFYAIAAQDAGMRDFLEHWVSLRRKDGTMDDYFDHWILGKTARANKPRWSVIRNVLNWVD